jgi:limonene-1,2-epoxide hydrolase
MNAVQDKSIEQVRAFMAAINGRDAPGAQALLSDGAKLVFPGGTSFRGVAQFLAWAATRYRWARYVHEEIDVVHESGRCIVYARGSVSGELNDGTLFDAVRSIDRFVVVDGRIELKEAWSDVGDMLRRRDQQAAAGGLE